MQADSTTELAREDLPQIYYPLLDAIRFAAAIGVVWIHVAGNDRLAWSKELGRFAVPFFACSAVYLALGSLQRHPRTSLGHYIVSRFKRIYVLFLVWSVFYWMIRSASSLFVEHTGFCKLSAVDFFWNGVAVQLWFLPVVLLATVGAFSVAKALQLAPALRLPFLLVFAAAAFGLAFMPAPGFIQHAGYAAGLGYEIVPCCCAALALGLAETFASPKKEIPLRAGINLPMLGLGISLFMLWLVMALACGRNVAMENVAGFGLILVSLSWKTRVPVPSIMRLGAASFGMYLIHPLFVEGMQHILPKIGFGTQSSALEISIFLTSLVSSYLSVELLRRQKSTRWLTG